MAEEQEPEEREPEEQKPEEREPDEREGKRMTDILRSVQKGGEAIVFRHYYKVAWEYAEKHIDDSLKRFPGASDIAEKGVRCAISAMQSSPHPIQSSGEFERLLYGILDRRIADAARSEKAGRRGGGCVESLQGEPAARDSSTPLEVVASREVVEQIYSFVLKEEDPYQRDINVLGVLAHASASSIHKVMSALYPDRTPPAIRTIQLHLEKTRKKLAQHLKSAFDVDMPLEDADDE